MKINRKPFMNAVLTHSRSITELAAKVGIGSSTLYSALNTERTSLETLTKLCKVIGGKPEDFIDYTYKAPSPTVAVNVAALYDLRFQCDLKLKDLAAAAGITTNGLLYIMRTGRTRRCTLGKLAKALNVDVKELMGEGL